MNKKGQASNVLAAIVVIVLTGVMLAIFMPTIDEFRVDALQSMENDDVLEKMLLYGLKPIIWGFYIFLSVFAMIFTVNASSGVL